MPPIQLACVVGARPNFMKMAPLLRALEPYSRVETTLIHTGQHYDENLSDVFFAELGMKRPDVSLDVGSGKHGAQTARVLERMEAVLERGAASGKPYDRVVVVGDVNSTMAAALAAAKLGIPVAHVEAGLRSFDRSMPEEINRILTDSISDLLFCTERSGVDNLLKEGVAREKIYLVGHVMIDTLLKNLERAQESTILDDLRAQGFLDGEGFAVLTLHRPSNVDDPAAFSRILDALAVIQADLPILFPVHPRTRKNLITLGLRQRIEGLKNLHLLEPIGYLDFLKLTSSAAVVLTDSGGIQEETTILKVPCITLRENTERPITVTTGSNQLAGTDTAKIVAAYRNAVGGHGRQPQVPPLWDGHAAERIVKVLLETL
jgi:UDP-N-acetylglucosamine 2-epimerase (non-hydrolysing)